MGRIKTKGKGDKMKATGVVRRMDDLGRIVLPKELRRTMHIDEGDSLEIYIDQDNQIILKKYSPIQNMNDFLEELVDSLYTKTSKEILAFDKEKILVSTSGLGKNYVGQIVSNTLREELKSRTTKRFTNEPLSICEGFETRKNVLLVPILVYGDILGGILLFSDSAIVDKEVSMVELTTTFLSKYLEK